MAAGVHQDAAVREARAVADNPRGIVDAVGLQIEIKVDHLRQRLQCVVAAVHGAAVDRDNAARGVGGGHVQQVRLIDVQLQRHVRVLKANAHRGDGIGRRDDNVCGKALVRKRANPFVRSVDAEAQPDAQVIVRGARKTRLLPLV